MLNLLQSNFTLATFNFSYEVNFHQHKEPWRSMSKKVETWCMSCLFSFLVQLLGAFKSGLIALITEPSTHRTVGAHPTDCAGCLAFPLFFYILCTGISWRKLEFVNFIQELLLNRNANTIAKRFYNVKDWKVHQKATDFRTILILQVKLLTDFI